MVASGLQESEYETSFFLVYLLIKNNSSGGNHAGRTFKKHQRNGDIPVLNYRQGLRFTTFIFVTWFFLVRLVTFSLTEVDKVKIYFCRKRIDTLATEKFHHAFQKLLRACKVHKIILLGGSRINFVPISPALIGNIYRSEEDLPPKAPYQDKTCICCNQIFWEFFDEDVQASFQTERRCPCVSNHEPRFEARVSRARFACGPHATIDIPPFHFLAEEDAEHAGNCCTKAKVWFLFLNFLNFPSEFFLPYNAISQLDLSQRENRTLLISV